MNFLRKVISLCSGFKPYRNVRDLPVIASVLYLLKLASLLMLLLTASLIPWTLTLVDDFATWADQHLPSFSITDGKVTTNVTQPYRAGTSTFLFILDTTGQVTGPQPNALQGLLLTRDKFLLWINSSSDPKQPPRIHTQTLEGFPDGTVNGDYLKQLFHAFLWVGAPSFWVAAVLVMITATGFQAIFFSAVAAWMERTTFRNNTAVSFGQMLNIAIHANTPAAILITIYMAMHLEGLNYWLIYLIAYGITVIGAANACRDTAPRPTVK